MARERRDVTEIRLDPAGPEEPGAVKSFNLVKITKHEYKPSRSGRWLTDPDRFMDDREVVATGLTRRQVAELVTDAVDWLSYIEGEGS